MNIGWSTYTQVSDPGLLEIGSNVIIGVETLISGHSIINDKLYLGKIIIEDDSLVGGQCSITPGVHIGKGAVVEAGTTLLPFATVPTGVRVGKLSVIKKGSLKTPDEKIPDFFGTKHQSGDTK